MLSRVLIVPCGIEMRDFSRIRKLSFVLIVPCGIEMPDGSNTVYVWTSLNRTMWN